MILGIGIDICDINRLSKTLERYEKRFEERCFTELERKKCQRSFSKKNCYAKRFAAKEATSKALGTGINKGVSWKQIEVENLKSGKPIINLYGNAKKILESMSMIFTSPHLKHYILNIIKHLKKWLDLWVK